jgi:fatty acid desaturase
MAFFSASPEAAQVLQSVAQPPDPRAIMAARLPAWTQPFLTWLTAKPAPGEAPVARPALNFVMGALTWMLLGCGLTLCPLLLTEPPLLTWLMLPAGLLATCCGLGIFQVVVFHHCSHGTVFRSRERNRRVGRLISA